LHQRCRTIDWTKINVKTQAARFNFNLNDSLLCPDADPLQIFKQKVKLISFQSYGMYSIHTYIYLLKFKYSLVGTDTFRWLFCQLLAAVIFGSLALSVPRYFEYHLAHRTVNGTQVLQVSK